MQCPELRGLYRPEKLIGQGASGLVYKARRFRDNRLCAIKRFHLTVPPTQIHSEILFLRLIGDQPHIVSLLDAFRRGPQLSLVLSHCSSKDFEEIYQDMTPTEIRTYLRQLLEALCCLHAHGVTHRDVKPANFLYDPGERSGMLIDFGLAEVNPNFQPILPPAKTEAFLALKRLHKGSKTGVRGTRGFLAPECLFESECVTSAVDIWGVGVILLSFLSGRYPFFRFSPASCVRKLDFRVQGLLQLALLWGRSELEQLAGQFQCTLQLPESLPSAPIRWSEICPKADPEALDLLERMLALQPSQRITALDALSHPFLHSACA